MCRDNSWHALRQAEKARRDETRKRAAELPRGRSAQLKCRAEDGRITWRIPTGQQVEAVHHCSCVLVTPRSSINQTPWRCSAHSGGGSHYRGTGRRRCQAMPPPCRHCDSPAAARQRCYSLPLAAARQHPAVSAALRSRLPLLHVVLQRRQPLHHFRGAGPQLGVQAHALHHQVARLLQRCMERLKVRVQHSKHLRG